MSRTYQLSATPVAANDAKDASNTLYWRANRRRVEAEGVWDFLLQASGTLDTTAVGGPSADLDEKTLRAIAEMTGGEYFRARDTQELDRIYAMLDELEPVERDVRRFRPRKALYFWPLAGAFAIAGFLLLYNLKGRTL